LESPPSTQSHDLTLSFPRNPSARSQLTRVTGDRVPQDCGPPVTKTCLPGVPPPLSPEEPISQGRPSYPLLSSGLTMEIGPSQIPSDSPSGCLLANLGHLHLTPDLKSQKLIFLCNQAWPQNQFDNVSKWPLNATFNCNILRDLYNSCEHTCKWKEIPYTQSFSCLGTKPSLHTSCSPVQVL
jgi:hypothetical protein